MNKEPEKIPFTSTCTDIDKDGNPCMERDERGRFKKQKFKGRITGYTEGRKKGSKNVLTVVVKDLIKEKGVPFIEELLVVGIKDLKKHKKATNAVKLCSAFLLKQMPTLKAILIDDAKGMSAMQQLGKWTAKQKDDFIQSAGEVMPSDAEISDLVKVNKEQEEEEP